jgi:hypothetical protein
MLLIIGIIVDLIAWRKESSSEKENNIGNNAGTAFGWHVNVGI